GTRWRADVRPGSRRRRARGRSARDERVPKPDRGGHELVARADHPFDPAARDFLEYRVPLARYARRERSAVRRVEWSAGLEKIRQLEHPSDVVPMYVPVGVVGDAVAHAPISLAGR